MELTIDTKMITLLGDPLKQSFAAQMQNAGYADAGLDMCYFYTEVDNENLEDVINGIRYMNFAGFAVTKPNKVKVLDYLDELDPLCAKMGASNTVKKTEDGRLIGYNTDGIGFIRSLEREGGLNVSDHTYFLIGAGGAGRAIACALAYYGAKKIIIMDYFDASARSLTEDINTNFAPVAEYVTYDDFTRITEADVVINASGIGMGDSIGKSPLQEEYFNENTFYFDACYNPAKTQFLLNAEKAGGRILNGLGMSLYQGAAQIEIWSGKEPPIEAMRQKLIEIIREK